MKFKLLLFLSFLSITICAQKIDVSKLEGLKIRNIGPAGMSGRVTAIDVNLSNPQIIFVGTASGGVWQTENGGISWKPVFDEAPVQSVGSIAINQKNPAEIWVGTGEGNPRNSHNSGNGIYKSIDGGKTWMDMGLKKTKLIHRIIIHRDDPNTVYAGVLGSAWGPSKHRGVYKTTNGGKTWKKILYIGEEVGVADMVVDPSNPNKLLVAMWEFGRKPWTFNSGGKDSGMHLTYDGGKTWKKLTNKEGLPKGDLGRIGLAFAPSKPSTVYALVEAKENAFYKSTDGGENWKKMATDDKIGNRPFYYSDIFVDPINENRIISIHSVITKSEDGGKTFESFVGWNIHPDHHAFWIHPTDPDFMIDGNDGGLNISRDGGKNWRFVENLPLAQFYHIDYDMDIPYNVCGGMQDNGSWVGPSAVWKRGGIRNADWQEVLFGDGFDVALRHDNSRYGWGMSQGGYLSYFDRLTGHTQYIRPAHPEGDILRFSWNAALAKVPDTDCGIYYGSQYVHRSLDCGQTWEILSPDLTTNDSTKQKQTESGGLTKDVTAAENF
ncbi:MAG: WD40/YVTN/BNR-like repeat-containing protein, partial [Saprospiraceae bacterium]